MASAQEKSAFASFLDLPYRYVIGGHANGRWLKSEVAGKRLNAPSTDYRIFTLGGEEKPVVAAVASS